MYAMIALLSEGKYDVIIPAPNRKLEAKNLRPLRSELPAVWSDIPNAMRGLKDHSLHRLVMNEALGLELSNFSRQLKLKPGIHDDHRVIVGRSNYVVQRNGDKGRRRKETKGQRNESSLDSFGFTNEARGKQGAAL